MGREQSQTTVDSRQKSGTVPSSASEGETDAGGHHLADDCVHGRLWFLSQVFLLQQASSSTKACRQWRNSEMNALTLESLAAEASAMRTRLPKVATKRSERLRRQQRKERLILIGVVLAVAAAAALGTYLKYEHFIKPRDHQEAARDCDAKMNAA
jgi:hypothetical protein